ncbi:MAG: Recombination protein RecR [uncultured Campylobacterales bacterium]|uniref:Recombination protein RecR n=1 Tax=uncultured Campylobacterales bacterium TaxID=352960 RepID=A0A6S6SM58_9BACT|nr:MAG: Recombination protein RecR [uncultured Campylobacterales bacterium]
MKNHKFNTLIETLSELPTVGKKSASRFAYHLIFKDSFLALKLAHNIEDAINNVKKCGVCQGISESEICYICLDSSRDNEKLCIVSSPQDILIFEENKLYDGKYFVIEDLESFDEHKLKNLVLSGVNELIFALEHSIGNDALILYIEDKLKDHNLTFTKLAQGIPSGMSLQNIDIVSLNKAILQRTKT